MDDGKKCVRISAIRDCQEPIKVKRGDKLEVGGCILLETTPCMFLNHE